MGSSRRFYRSRDGGVLTIPVALVALFIIEAAAGYVLLPFFGIIRLLFSSFELENASLVVNLSLGAASALLLSAVTWALVRDMPVRNDTADRRLEAADVRRRSRK